MRLASLRFGINLIGLDAWSFIVTGLSSLRKDLLLQLTK